MSITGSVVLMLVYEPASTDSGPLPVARLSDPGLTVAVAKAAVSEAEARAREISRLDEVLGRIEQLEAHRLRDLLKLLIPGFHGQTSVTSSDSPVM
jgi:hypothetical protein